MTSVEAKMYQAEGEKAYHQNLKVGDNPYREDSDRHWHWRQGWVSAAEEHQQRKILKPGERLQKQSKHGII